MNGRNDVRGGGHDYSESMEKVIRGKGPTERGQQTKPGHEKRWERESKKGDPDLTKKWPGPRGQDSSTANMVKLYREQGGGKEAEV